MLHTGVGLGWGEGDRSSWPGQLHPDVQQTNAMPSGWWHREGPRLLLFLGLPSDHPRGFECRHCWHIYPSYNANASKSRTQSISMTPKLVMGSLSSDRERSTWDHPSERKSRMRRERGRREDTSRPRCLSTQLVRPALPQHSGEGACPWQAQGEDGSGERSSLPLPGPPTPGLFPLRASRPLALAWISHSA